MGAYVGSAEQFTFHAQYWYASGVYYALQNGQYVVVPPPHGAVVSTEPPSCSVIYVGNSTRLDCGGAFYCTCVERLPGDPAADWCDRDQPSGRCNG